MGKAVVLELAENGVKSIVIHGSKSGKKLDALIGKVQNLGVTATPFPFSFDSVNSIDSIKDFLKASEPYYETDILVCAFGPFLYKPLTETTDSDWQKTVLLDLALPGALISKVLPGMISRGFGRILLFGGTRTDTIHAFRMNAAYAAAKTGLNVLAKSVAETYSPYNIACTVLCPGFVDTEYVEPAEKARLASMTPCGRLTDPAEIAEIAVRIIMENPSLHNGAVIPLDGGISI